MGIYEEFIQNVLDTRGRFGCGDTYHERHHIKPKCIGGTNDEDNLIDLFAREHFVAHKLLAEENPENEKLVYAYSMMAFASTDEQKRYELTPEEYENARKMLSETKIGKERPEWVKKKIREGIRTKRRDMSGANNYNYGKRLSEETRQKISISTKKRLSIPENNPMYGKHHSEETRKMQSELKKGKYSGENNPMFGRPWWDENTPQEKIEQWRDGISKRTSGENNPNYGVKCTEEKRTKLIQSNPNTQAVVHLSLDGSVIEEYRSKREANRITGINRSTLALYCNGEKSPPDGTIWKIIDKGDN